MGAFKKANFLWCLLVVAVTEFVFAGSGPGATLAYVGALSVLAAGVFAWRRFVSSAKRETGQDPA